MDFYTRDFLASTGHMLGHERGLYALTLIAAWSMGGKLPADPDRIRRAVGYDREEFAADWPGIAEKWPEIGDGWRANPKQQSVYAEAMSRVEHGRKGAAARWKDEKRASVEHPSGICPNDAEPEPEPEPEIPKRERGRVAYSPDFEDFWTHYPKKSGKGEAFKRWRGLTPDERSLALVAVVRFAEAWENAPTDRVGYIVDPERWISRRRWEDDPAVWWTEAKGTAAQSRRPSPPLVGVNAYAPPPDEKVAIEKLRAEHSAKLEAERLAKRTA